MASDEEDEIQLLENEPGVLKKKRGNYTVEYKLEAIEWGIKYSIKSAAKKFTKGNRARIQNWTKQKTKLQRQEEKSANAFKRRRVEGGGRNVLHGILDDQLADWIRDKRQNKLPVSRRIIRNEAMSTFGNTDMKISNGWLEKFLKRHNFVLRRRTTVCQHPPKNYIESIAKFIVHVEQLRKSSNFNEIFAFDETAIWFDNPENRVIETRGAKDVTVLTTGHEKMRITVGLCAREDGKKMNPYVLVNRKRPDPKIVEKFKGKLVINWAGSVWMNDSHTEDFLRKVIGGCGPFKKKRLLVWDAFGCHKSEATAKVLSELEIKTAIIPGGCTKFIQAPDVSWNKPLKEKIRHRYNLWIMNDAHKEFTAAGNPKAPSLEIVLEWVCDAWEELEKAMIIKSFKACALSTALDGSEDNKIYCFQPDGPIGIQGQDLLRELRATAEGRDGRFDDEDDGFSDEQNSAIADLENIPDDDELSILATDY